MRLILMAGALAVAFAPGFAGAAKARVPIPVKILVTAERGVADRDRVELEESIVSGLTEAACPAELAPPEGAAVLTLRVHVQAWREADTPGGEPVFDSTTGRDLPGRRRDVAVRYTLAMADAAGNSAANPKERAAHGDASTRALATWEPRIEARRMALQYIVTDAVRTLCREARKLPR